MIGFTGIHLTTTTYRTLIFSIRQFCEYRLLFCHNFAILLVFVKDNELAKTLY